MNTMKFSSIVVGVCIAILVCSFFILNSMQRSPYDPATASYQEKLAYWNTRVGAVGGVPAYKELATFLKGFTVEIQHNETHAFGTALYEQVGIEGIAVCDDRFEYACFHQVIGEIFADLGMDSFSRIVEACKGGPACLHSIGHGVLAQQGYAVTDLQNALKGCEALPSAVYVEGCYGGVFMEYNMRRLLGDDQLPRPLGKNWLDPCDQFSGVLGRICFYWQPTWWRSALSSDDLHLSPAGFQRMGALCSTITDTELKASCFEGTGVIAMNSGRTPKEGVSACSAVSSEALGVALCRTGAARLIALLGQPEVARSVCLELSGVYRDGCLNVIITADPHKSF